MATGYHKSWCLTGISQTTFTASSDHKSVLSDLRPLSHFQQVIQVKVLLISLTVNQLYVAELQLTWQMSHVADSPLTLFMGSLSVGPSASVLRCPSLSVTQQGHSSHAAGELLSRGIHSHWSFLMSVFSSQVCVVVINTNRTKSL